MLQPESNRHQLAALDHVMAIAARVDTVEAFLEQTSQLRHVVEGSLLDREWNREAIALRLDDPWLGAIPVSIEVPAAIQRLFSGLLDLHTVPIDPVGTEALIQESFRRLRALDAGFGPDTWFQWPRYHRRLPWPEPLVRSWLEPLWRLCPNTASLAPVSDLAGRSAQWLRELLPFSGEWPAVEPLDLIVIEPPIRDQTQWPDAVLYAHDLATRAALRAATTPIGLEAISTERALSRAVLACRNRFELSTLLAPFRAAALGLPVKPALQVTGLSVEQLIEHPRVKSFFENNLLPHLNTNLDGFGAWDGEAGFALLVLAQAQPGVDFAACLRRES